MDMKTNRTILLSVVVLALVAVFVLSAQSRAAVTVGDKAPNFTLDTVDGKSKLNFSNYTNKPTVLVFWASWCPHCQKEAPRVQNIYNKFKAKGVNVVGISADEDVSEARNFVTSYRLTFPNAHAGSPAGLKVINDYGVEGVPAIFVIDKGGVVKALYIGETDEATIQAQLAKLGIK
jgi:peroxiredoxin